MRRKDREMDESFSLKLLEGCEYAFLSTINIDGTPYCIPISPVLVGRDVYFHCAPEGKKLENIANNANVCVTCVGHTKLMPEKFSTEFESAVAMGTCSVVEDDEEKIMALRVICEKFAQSNMANFDKAISASLHRTTVCKIHIAEITGKAKIYNLSK